MKQQLASAPRTRRKLTRSGRLRPRRQLREIAACQLALARMDVQCPAGLHWLADFSHTAYGNDELVAKAYGCGLRADLWIDNHNIGLRKEHFCQGSIRLQTSRAEIVGDTRRASDIWSTLVGGDSRDGTGLSVSTTRVTSKMPPAIRTSATRVFVMARSLFIIPKIWERWVGALAALRAREVAFDA
jgi:hypothetical protein